MMTMTVMMMVMLQRWFEVDVVRLSENRRTKKNLLDAVFYLFQIPIQTLLAWFAKRILR